MLNCDTPPVRLGCGQNTPCWINSSENAAFMMEAADLVSKASRSKCSSFSSHRIEVLLVTGRLTQNLPSWRKSLKLTQNSPEFVSSLLAWVFTQNLPSGLVVRGSHRTQWQWDDTWQSHRADQMSWPWTHSRSLVLSSRRRVLRLLHRSVHSPHSSRGVYRLNQANTASVTFSFCLHFSLSLSRLLQQLL